MDTSLKCEPKKVFAETEYRDLSRRKDGYYYSTPKIVKDSVNYIPSADLKKLSICYALKKNGTKLPKKLKVLDYAYELKVTAIINNQPKIYRLIFHLFYREC